jgi:phosphoglycerol transferase MdoB-like AlkP superfamily enzyme
MLPRPNFSRGYFHLWLSLPVNGLAFPYRVSSFLFLLIITYHKISALRQLFDKNGCCIWQTWSLSTFLRVLFSMLSSFYCKTRHSNQPIQLFCKKIKPDAIL